MSLNPVKVVKRRVRNGQDSGQMNSRERQLLQNTLKANCYLDGNRAFYHKSREQLLTMYIKGLNFIVTQLGRSIKVRNSLVCDLLIPENLLNNIGLEVLGDDNPDQIMQEALNANGIVLDPINGGEMQPLLIQIELEPINPPLQHPQQQQQQPVHPPPPAIVYTRLEKNMAQARRAAIEYFYVHIYGSPPQHEWFGLDLVNDLSLRLQIPYGSRHNVIKTLKDIMITRIQHTQYNPKKHHKRRGLIVDQTPQAAIIYQAVEHGLSIALTTYMLNVWRAARDPSMRPVSFSAVEGFTLRSEIIVKSRRRTKKSGKEDPNTTWSVCRLAQCLQFKEQFRLGKLPIGHPDLINTALPLLKVHNIVFWDEKHQKVSRHNTQFTIILPSYSIRLSWDTRQNGRHGCDETMRVCRVRNARAVCCPLLCQTPLSSIQRRRVVSLVLLLSADEN